MEIFQQLGVVNVITVAVIIQQLAVGVKIKL
jgi:hypothetical protein